MDGASTDKIKKQVEECPLGALSYMSKKEGSQAAAHTETKVEALEDGPLLIYGTLHVTNPDGKVEKKSKTTAFCRCGASQNTNPDGKVEKKSKTTAFCRCGASQNKPYCDGAHVKVEFKG